MAKTAYSERAGRCTVCDLQEHKRGKRPQNAPAAARLICAVRPKRRKVFVHHLDVALGSQGEVDVQLEIAQRLRYLKVADYRHTQRAVEEIGRMLNGLIISLEPNAEDEPADY